jgi:hypothetical protein
MRNLFILGSILLIVLFTACGGDSTKGEDTAAEAASAKTQVSPQKKGLPTLPDVTMQLLIDSVDYIDYVFYELDFSMSLDNEQGVKYSLAKISGNPAELVDACKPIGRIFYQIKGRNAAEADLYFSQGCTYLVFMEDNAPVYANAMSDVGKTFLNNQFAAIMKGYQPIQ